MFWTWCVCVDCAFVLFVFVLWFLGLDWMMWVLGSCILVVLMFDGCLIFDVVFDLIVLTCYLYWLTYCVLECCLICGFVFGLLYCICWWIWRVSRFAKLSFLAFKIVLLCGWKQFPGCLLVITCFCICVC